MIFIADVESHSRIMIINAGGNLIIVTEVILRDFPMGTVASIRPIHLYWADGFPIPQG